MEFNVGDHVYLRVRARKSSLKLGSCAKLSPRYCGPFEVLERIVPIAYRISLPANTITHNVFHVSLLKKYVHDPNHVIDWDVIQVELEGVPNRATMHSRQEYNIASKPSHWTGCHVPIFWDIKSVDHNEISRAQIDINYSS